MTFSAVFKWGWNKGPAGARHCQRAKYLFIKGCLVSQRHQPPILVMKLSWVAASPIHHLLLLSSCSGDWCNWDGNYKTLVGATSCMVLGGKWLWFVQQLQRAHCIALRCSVRRMTHCPENTVLGCTCPHPGAFPEATLFQMSATRQHLTGFSG